MSGPALRRAVTGYALGVLLPGAALAVVLAASQLLGRAPELPFIVAVLITAWRGGRGPGLLAAAASTACRSSPG